MTSEEMRAAGRLATRTLADTVSNVEQIHHAAATRIFALTGPAGVPVRVVHNGIATGVYTLIRSAGLAAGWAASEVAGVAAGSARPVGSTPRSNLAVAVLNAFLGHELAEQGSPLAIPMAIRRDRADIVPERDALEAAFPEATTKVAVFVHGLTLNEESWRLHADRHGHGEEATYGSRFAEDFGYTPVYLRYNSGLHISENGHHLATLLEKVVGAWPVPVTELLLVGHSMGGLVARSACHQAMERGDSWVPAVRHIFYLGTPHLGAGLEQWVNQLTAMLGRLDESRPLASVLNRRSAGIKDLRAGHLLDDDWRRADHGSKYPMCDVPLLPSAQHYAVSATVTAGRRNPLGRVVGDLLVQPASARGRSRDGRHIPIPAEHKRHFEGLHHFRLLNHPPIYEAMREWLEPTSCVGSAVGSTLVSP